MTDRPKVLLVFYSRSGRTRAVAKAIGNSLSCDVEEIVDKTDRRGVRGYLRSGFEAFFRRETKLQPMTVNPADYDLVIVGTPVWNASVSAPVRAFFERYSGRLARVAFFLSYGGTGRRRVFHQMGRLARARPLATLAVREATIDHKRFDDEVHAFVEEVRTELQAEARSARESGIRISPDEPTSTAAFR